METRLLCCIATGSILASAAFGQVWTREEAAEEAVRIALKYGDGPRERLVADTVGYKAPSHPLAYPIGRGTWHVYFGDTIVSVSDGEPVRYEWSGPGAAQVEKPVAPFRPFLRTRQEWAEHGRVLA
ncbi:MAG: hypothetical protein AB7F50_05895 [Fimbriimonadaceae bacterium]